jgi:hypothetical protein
VVSREIEFAFGGLLILAGLIPIAIVILGSIPILNLGLIINFCGIGLVLGLLGFYLIGTALFRRE